MTKHLDVCRRVILVARILAIPVAARAAEPTGGIFEATVGEAGEATPELSTTELQAILQEKSALVFDARPAREFALGHIPGALNVRGKPGLPASQYTSDVRDVERVVGEGRSKRIVIYCNGPYCGRSKRLAADLLAAGFTNVQRYELGMPVFRALGGVAQIEPEGLRYMLERDRTTVVFDAGGGNVPGARALTADEVKAAKDDGRLPMEDHHARIIVVGGDTAQARAVAIAIAHEAFDNVSFLAGKGRAVVRDGR
ncbi:MAG: rhodanese-like domain-containing protein [Myxococcales bacterium]